MWTGPSEKSAPGAHLSTEQVAGKARISTRTVQLSKEVVTKAPDLADRVEAGSLSLKKAVDQIHKKEKAKKLVLDKMGYPVREPALPYWNRAPEVKQILNEIKELRHTAEELMHRHDPLYSEVRMQSVHIELGNIYTTMKLALPYAVCTVCQGQFPEPCTFCKGRGVISEFRYEHANPIESEQMREKQIEEFQAKQSQQIEKLLGSNDPSTTGA